nr:homeobox protein knotted-1-like LET12 isoform X2 [Ipomoea batatas]
MAFQDHFSQEMALQQQQQQQNAVVLHSMLPADHHSSSPKSPPSTEESSWEREKCKADILNHPLYDQLLSAHVSCLRIATPVDQLPRIDAQLAQSQNVVAKYSVLGQGQQPLDDKDLDQFMTHYVLLLSSFKEQLQQHVRVHAMEAVMACWELEQSLQSLTGVAPGEDTMGFGPLVPTESERSLMERVRQELKHELKHGYKEKIVDIREEILRKRRAGKLPGDTTSVLKAWWQSHSKWPYPTEEDKARLVQETGLQLKQINNWFINQRKRNWHSNPSSSSSQKSKRKSKVESVALSVVLERRRFPSLGVTILSDLPNHVLPLGPRNHLGKLLQFLELLPQPRPPAVILPSDQVPAVSGAGAEAAEAKTAAAARRRNGVVLVVESSCGAAFAGGFSYG